MFYYHKTKIENDAFYYSYETPRNCKKKKTKEDVKRELFTQ